MIENFRMGEVALYEHQPHVIAFNTWKGTDIPAPADALGLQYFTIVLPSASDLQRVISGGKHPNRADTRRLTRARPITQLVCF